MPKELVMYIKISIESPVREHKFWPNLICREFLKKFYSLFYQMEFLQLLPHSIYNKLYKKEEWNLGAYNIPHLIKQTNNYCTSCSWF